MGHFPPIYRWNRKLYGAQMKLIPLELNPMPYDIHSLHTHTYTPTPTPSHLTRYVLHHLIALEGIFKLFFVFNFYRYVNR